MKHCHFHATTLTYRSMPNAILSADGTLRCPFASCWQILPAKRPGCLTCGNCGRQIRIPKSPVSQPRAVSGAVSPANGEEAETAETAREIRLRQILRLRFPEGYDWHNELVA
jgi:hypothetical protein